MAIKKHFSFIIIIIASNIICMWYVNHIIFQFYEENEMDFLFWIRNNHHNNILYKWFVLKMFGIMPFVTTLLFARFVFSVGMFGLLILSFWWRNERRTLTFISQFLTDVWFYCLLFLRIRANWALNTHSIDDYPHLRFATLHIWICHHNIFIFNDIEIHYPLATKLCDWLCIQLRTLIYESFWLIIITIKEFHQMQNNGFIKLWNINISCNITQGDLWNTESSCKIWFSWNLQVLNRWKLSITFQCLNF